MITKMTPIPSKLLPFNLTDPRTQTQWLDEPEPSIPRRLFDAITAHSEAAAIDYLESLVSADEKTFEDQYLEFKGGRVRKVGDPWSRQLSAFGNTDGGVVVWGIGTERENGVDYASVLDKVSDPLSLKAELEKDLQHATEVIGLAKSGMELVLTVFSLDQMPVTVKVSIDATIKEQILQETRCVTRVTINLEPPREFVPIR